MDSETTIFQDNGTLEILDEEMCKNIFLRGQGMRQLKRI